MERLTIKKTRSTPEIDFDPEQNILRMSSESCPENVLQFYEPVFTWLDNYLEQLRAPCVMEMRLSYLNTASTKCILFLLQKLDLQVAKGKEIRVMWFYDQDNEVLKECGEEFNDFLALPFQMIPIEMD